MARLLVTRPATKLPDTKEFSLLAATVQHHTETTMIKSVIRRTPRSEKIRHNTQSKWRDQKLANDWDSLTTEVKRWQNNLGLRWDDKQITLVALYMNRRYYKFSAPAIVSQ